MAKKIIFQESFLVTGIMCYEGCGKMLQGTLGNLDTLKRQKLLPQDAQLIINAEPHALGIHQLIIAIESEQEDFGQDGIYHHDLSVQFKQRIEALGFAVTDKGNSLASQSTKSNWLNIAINLLVVALTIALSAIFPPSLFLTTSLVALTFLTTAFTARNYLRNFFSNLRNKHFATMATPITLGWLLSLSHTIYHAIRMPLAASFSMMFMNFHMPIILITLLNIMDAIKVSILNKVQKLHLQGLKSLFPQMAEEYACYQLSPQEQEKLAQQIKANEDNETLTMQYGAVNHFLQQKRYLLKKGMLIAVKRNECFPVDGIIIHGNTLVDTSLITGETRQRKQPGSIVHAGAVNLHGDVIFYATEEGYCSTINKLLFGSNRAREEKMTSQTKPRFAYLYIGLIIASMIAAIAIPYALGIFTLPLLLQNIMGILFSICPCTIAIAHELPKLLSFYQRSHRGITLRDDSLLERFDELHTFVFDKTGTLTTGQSQVAYVEGISDPLWHRIYLLEEHHGDGHPLAMAISNYYKARKEASSILIKDIQKVVNDKKHRGLSAIVQGKEIHLGSLAYMQENGISFSRRLSAECEGKLSQGYTPIYVAEDKMYQGIILVTHEIREDLVKALMDIKKERKTLIMLTGDSREAAMQLNQQIGSIFSADNIYAQQTPDDKEAFLRQLNTRDVCFVGDGLNDAPCSRIVSEKGGISCSITSTDKSAFFTDLSLNGTLDYLFAGKQLNHFLRKIILQNQLIIAYSTFAFLAFIIGFSIVGIAVSPLIPMAVMVTTTLFCLFNSYRAKLSVDQMLVKNCPWPERFLVSDMSIILPFAASVLFITSVLILTFVSGGLALPTIAFGINMATTISSVCLAAAGAMLGLFSIINITHLLSPDKTTHGSTEKQINYHLPEQTLSDNFISQANNSLEKNREKAYRQESLHAAISDEESINYSI